MVNEHVGVPHVKLPEPSFMPPQQSRQPRKALPEDLVVEEGEELRECHHFGLLIIRRLVLCGRHIPDRFELPLRIEPIDSVFIGGGCLSGSVTRRGRPPLSGSYRLSSTGSRIHTSSSVLSFPVMTSVSPVMRLCLTTCGCCDAARSRSHGKRRAVFYGCAAYHRRGKSICANSLTVPMAATDDAVLSVVEDAILRPEVVEAVIERAVEQLTATTVESRRPSLEADLAALDGELARLTGAIATGGELPALLEAVQDREQRRESLRRELEVLGASEPVVLDRAALRKNLESRLGDWRGLLRRHTAQGQQILRRLLVGRLTFTPTEDETGRYYAFHGTGTLTKLVGGLVPHNVASPTGIRTRVLALKGRNRGQRQPLEIKGKTTIPTSCEASVYHPKSLSEHIEWAQKRAQ